MKTGNFRAYIVVTIILGIIACCVNAVCQGIELIADPEKSKSLAEQWLSFLAPIATTVGAMRLAAKPISTWLAGGIERVVTKVEETESAEDDKILDAVLSSKPYFWAAWLIDYTLSIKLPVKKSKPISAVPPGA